MVGSVFSFWWGNEDEKSFSPLARLRAIFLCLQSKLTTLRRQRKISDGCKATSVQVPFVYCLTETGQTSRQAFGLLAKNSYQEFFNARHFPHQKAETTLWWARLFSFDRVSLSSFWMHTIALLNFLCYNIN